MKLKWTGAALSDLGRLHDFLAPVNQRAADRLVQSLTAAPERLIEHSRFGQKVEGFAHRDVRRILVGDYEMRYEVLQDAVQIVRIWHAREDR